MVLLVLFVSHLQKPILNSILDLYPSGLAEKTEVASFRQSSGGPQTCEICL